MFEGVNMKHGLVQVVFGLAVLTTCPAVMAEDSHRWETATVISQTIGSSVMGDCNAQLGSGSVASATNRESNTVVVDTGTTDIRGRRSPAARTGITSSTCLATTGSHTSR